MSVVDSSRATVRTYADLIRDLRHLDARAASALAEWLAYLEAETKADRTLYSYMRACAGLLNDYPEVAFEEFTARQITAHLATKPARSRYINRSILNTWFQWGEDQEILERNPMPGKVPKMRQPPRRPKDIFSEAERALLEMLPTPDGPLCAILFGTGLRKSEAIHLRREHIDLNRERLIVHNGKGGKDRIVPPIIPVQQAVAELDLAEQLQPEHYLWYTTRGKRRLRRDPIGDSTMGRWWGDDPRRAGVIQRAQVRYLSMHQTRHTFGHWLREQGFDIEERKEYMGHDDIRTTEKYYGRVTIEDVARKVKELGL